MSDEPESEKTLKSFFSIDKAADAIATAVEEEVSRIEQETGDEVDAVEIIQTEDNKPQGGFIYQEPTTDSVTAKMMRKLGLGGRMMPMKPWKGKDRWECTRCKWQTFKQDKAKKHVCG